MCRHTSAQAQHVLGGPSLGVGKHVVPGAWHTLEIGCAMPGTVCLCWARAQTGPSIAHFPGLAVLIPFVM